MERGREREREREEKVEKRQKAKESIETPGEVKAVLQGKVRDTFTKMNFSGSNFGKYQSSVSGWMSKSKR